MYKGYTYYSISTEVNSNLSHFSEPTKSSFQLTHYPLQDSNKPQYLHINDNATIRHGIP